MATYCENCGCKMFNGACTNCHEEVYIAEQHMELGTWNQTSEDFKKKVAQQQTEIANGKIKPA